MGTGRHALPIPGDVRAAEHLLPAERRSLIAMTVRAPIPQGGYRWREFFIRLESGGMSEPYVPLSRLVQE